jgi:hypothetical protein
MRRTGVVVPPNQQRIKSQGELPVPNVQVVRLPIRPYVITNIISGLGTLKFEIDDRTRHMLFINDGAVLLPGSNLLWNWQSAPPTGLDGVVHPGETIPFDDLQLGRASILFLAGENVLGDLRFFIYGW